MKIKKVMATALIGIVSVCSLAACGGKSAPNTADDIEFFFWKSGLGVEYIEQIVREFEAEYPQYNVDITAKSNSQISNFGLGGEKYDTVDLYFAPFDGSRKLLKQNAAPLNEVAEHTVSGEGMSIGEKMNQDLLANMKDADGNYYTLSYGGGNVSIAYNADWLKDEDVPLTTDQLLDTASRFVAGTPKRVPFMNFKKGGYWENVVQVWQIQYSGSDYYENRFRPLKDVEGNSPAKSVMSDKKDGRYEVLQLCQRLLSYQNVFNGSNGLDFTSAQTKFMNGDAVMMANGSWLMNEMRSSSSPYKNFKMMKVPVISSIVDRMEIDDDGDLQDIIRIVDAAGGDKSAIPASAVETYGQGDIDIVWEARNMMGSISDQSSIIVPEYSRAKEATMTFLKFYFSDRAMRIMMDATKTPAPVARFGDGSIYDVSNENDWIRQQFEYNRTLSPVFKNNTHTSNLFIAGGMSPWLGVDFVSIFSAQDEDDRLDADGVWTRMMSVLDGKWDSYVNNAKA